ncbi:MAG: response regulator transcription factor [Cryobacterium sp.]|nr:response regulator transcription factor [Cryobacterium sp.]
MPTPVLVVDDHRTFAELMRLGLDAQADFHCAAIAYGVGHALRVAAAVPYRAAIVDLGLPDGDGADLVGELRRLTPEARVVVLTAHPRSDVARRALSAGAHRVLPKRGRLDEVFDALRHVGTDIVPAAKSLLTPRETAVVALLADGMDVQGIAARLELSPYTVRDHVKSVLAKLGARTQLEAVVIAAREGIVVMEPR